jgi:hypothetical protein
MDQDQWISGALAARMLGVRPERVIALADQGHIARRRLPGSPPKYGLKSVEALRDASIEPVRAE